MALTSRLPNDLLNDKLKIIASARYDKNENFDGRFTPRVSAVIKVAEDNNIRLSYQQAYRFASTQQQYINLRVVGGTLFNWRRIKLYRFLSFEYKPCLYS